MRVHHWLLPASWLYGLGVGLRNYFFDRGLLHSQDFGLPVISVGNLAVGGTGKTPHVEYLLRRLLPHWPTAVLSRGYRRESSGFVLADDSSTARDIGDEPMQIHSKFAKATVAVDADRCEGIRLLMERTDAQVVVLDDAFQHRYVRPGLSIVLIEYDRLTGDRLLPAGRLREPMSGLRRAHVVVVTKCPEHLSAEQQIRAVEALRRYTQQPVFLSTTVYDEPTSTPDGHTLPWEGNVLLVSGIAQPAPLRAELERRGAKVTHLAFADHHPFGPADQQRINDTFAALPEPKMVVTTEKDAARLATAVGLSPAVRQALHPMPIHVRFLADGDRFDQLLTDYVATALRPTDNTTPTL